MIAAGRPAGATRPSLSVVVMGYRNEKTIADAVQSVVEQASPEPFEIVVVTSGDDESRREVEGRFPCVRCFHSLARLFPGAARNAGAAMASAEVIAFLEGDCRAEPGWVAGRIAAHRDGHEVVASAVTCGGPQRPWAWAWHFVLYSGRLPGRPPGPVVYPDPAAHGLSFTSAVQRRLGPFDEGLPLGEDTEAARALAELGVAVWFEPAVRLSHPGPTSTAGMLRDLFRRGRMAARGRRAVLPPTTRGQVIVEFVPVWLSNVRRTALGSWVRSRTKRWRVVVSLPWIAAAQAARLAGWYGQRLADGRERGAGSGPDATEAARGRPASTEKS